jgi:4-hydroxythreonine-4-phosphate dehydrogenase
MEQAIRIAGSPQKVNAIQTVDQSQHSLGIVDVLDLHNVDLAALPMGQVSAMAGQAAFEAIETAIQMALDRQLDATVTAPINKESINLAGHSFAGHTEIFAQYTGSRDVAMMLISGSLRVIHVTTHLSMRQACDLIKKERILKVIRMFQTALRQLGILHPKIAVAGLNPHAGDGGLFGTEEAEEIRPAVEEAQNEGIQAEGPLPPDTIFSFLQGGFYDGCVAMYHDQGHIPFKMSEFEWDNQKMVMKNVRGINVTLGLPIIRVSVDHGTAFPIAGKGVANCESMIQAIEYAVTLAKNRRASTASG